MEKDIIKITKSIDSCINLSQLVCCQKLFSLFLRKTKQNPYKKLIKKRIKDNPFYLTDLKYDLQICIIQKARIINRKDIRVSLEELNNILKFNKVSLCINILKF